MERTIGSFTPDRTPMLREFLQEHPDAAGKEFDISTFICSSKGILCIEAKDQFVCFAFKGTSIWKALTKYLTAQGDSIEYELSPRLSPEGETDGSFTMFLGETHLCLMDLGETSKGNDKYTVVHKQTISQVKKRGYPIGSTSKKIIETSKLK